MTFPLISPLSYFCQYRSLKQLHPPPVQPWYGPPAVLPAAKRACGTASTREHQPFFLEESLVMHVLLIHNEFSMPMVGISHKLLNASMHENIWN